MMGWQYDPVWRWVRGQKDPDSAVDVCRALQAASILDNERAERDVEEVRESRRQPHAKIFVGRARANSCAGQNGGGR